jgi:hypothetical protein
VLLGLLLVVLYGIPLTGDHWIRLGLLMGMALLFFTFFVVLGILVSSLTRRSVVSFLVSLVIWVTIVLIVPRLGVMAAGRLMPVPTVAEVEATRDAFAKDCWEKHMQQNALSWRAREEQMHSLSDNEREVYREEHLPAWMDEDDAKRKQVQKTIEEFSIRLNEDLRNKKSSQEVLAMGLSRVSPASTFQLAAMKLAGTDIALKSRYEDSMRGYRTRFNSYVEKKQKETGNAGGFRVTVDSEHGVKFTAPREGGSLDLSDLPSFAPPTAGLREIGGSLVMDAGQLALASLLAFAGAFIAFLRYDVR